MNSIQNSTTSSTSNMSSGEKNIANVLRQYGIPFQYEAATLVKDRGKERIWYPNFHIIPYDIFVEYFGATNQPNYEKGIQHRLNVYAQNGRDVIDMYPTSFTEGWEDRMMSRVENKLQSRLYRWQNQYLSRRTHYHSKLAYERRRFPYRFDLVMV